MARPSSRPGPEQEFRALIIPKGMKFESEIKVRDAETPTEQSHRHRMEVRRFWLEEAPFHMLAIGIGVTGTIAALVLMFRPNSTFEEQKWAFTVLSNLLSAVAGFAFGKAAQ